MLLNFEHISKNGIDYVLVPEKDFKQIQEELEDADDLRYLRTAQKDNEGKPTLTHGEMMKELGLEEAEDILDLEKAITEEQHIPGFTLEEVKKTLDIK